MSSTSYESDEIPSLTERMAGLLRARRSNESLGRPLLDPNRESDDETDIGSPLLPLGRAFDPLHTDHSDFLSDEDDDAEDADPPLFPHEQFLTPPRRPSTPGPIEGPQTAMEFLNSLFPRPSRRGPNTRLPLNVDLNEGHNREVAEINWLMRTRRNDSMLEKICRMDLEKLISEWSFQPGSSVATCGRIADEEYEGPVSPKAPTRGEPEWKAHSASELISKSFEFTFAYIDDTDKNVDNTVDTSTTSQRDQETPPVFTFTAGITFPPKLPLKSSYDPLTPPTRPLNPLLGLPPDWHIASYSPLPTALRKWRATIANDPFYAPAPASTTTALPDGTIRIENGKQRSKLKRKITGRFFNLPRAEGGGAPMKYQKRFFKETRGEGRRGRSEKIRNDAFRACKKERQARKGSLILKDTRFAWENLWAQYYWVLDGEVSEDACVQKRAWESDRNRRLEKSARD